MSFIVRDAAGNEVIIAGMGGGGSANAVTVPGGAAISMGEGIGPGAYKIKCTPEESTPDLTASDVSYDGASSGLAATTVQDAVDEVAGKLAADGVPVGAVISFLGLAAPEGYLVCDGSAYSIADYPALSAFIAAQFGNANHFGGDGTATFAVPDMRNLFLRGYHGAAEEQLSGDIGKRQEATEIPRFTAYAPESNLSAANITFALGESIFLWNADKRFGISGKSALMKGQTEIFTTSDENTFCNTYTPRPVNMAILYCIKSV